MIYLGIPVATLGLALLIVAYARLRARRSDYGRTLEDGHIRQIEQEGWVVLDTDAEPLDIGRIEEAERQFWTEEMWDEGEEWS